MAASTQTVQFCVRAVTDTSRWAGVAYHDVSGEFP
jgi:hypothetical protein